MTAAEFKQAQSRLVLTNKALADILCCSERLVEMMRSGDRAVSARTEKLMKREIQPR